MGSHLQVISGQFLSERSVRTYVEVELFGLPGDPKRRYRTKLSPTANSINPIWNEEPFVFEKVGGLGQGRGWGLGWVRAVPNSWPLLIEKIKYKEGVP